MPLPKVTIYTDGSSLGNPGPGGWGAVLMHRDKRRELSAGFRETTNNRMEILAVIEGLAVLKTRADVNLYTDSRYLHDAVNKHWIKGWLKNGWKTASKKPVKNKDLWLRLLPLLDKHRVNIHWIKAHNGTPENERCDILAKEAAMRPDLPPDEEYEQGDHKG
jgi:ribonuclease HI